MNKNNFDETMERLNKYYDKMPTQSSSANIMATIKKKKKRNWIWARSYQRWQVAALVVFMLGIGYVLGASQFSGNESATQLNTQADQAPMESMSIMEDHEGEEAVEENRMFEFTSEEETKSIQILDEEGMEDEKLVRRLEVEGLSFTTYYDNDFELEEITSEEGRAVQIFANYGQGRVEPVLFEVYKFADSNSYDQVVEAYKARMSDSGFSEVATTHYFENIGVPGQVVEEFMFEKDGVNAHVVPIEHVDGYYFLRVSSFSVDNTEMIEFSEGFGREVNIILNEFNWIYE
ncbi:hypothetical protein [Halalkalibacter okhensis]|uniref:Uncharacterized protein n=1 Tax=Halalkalibacter okhensis TaxID=333138 RepID=A0A0B0IFF2_9BACI|nr:hypothetical protein [Halalkalibacter okhensis]KHF40045.1 hypothetical protein LQ50_12245 [Halalkalibacter okhensis]